jgi:uncharacterized membrane protein
MNRGLSFLTKVGLGAGLMYFLDPERGNRRRALVRDQVTSLLHKSDDAIDKTARDMRNRAQGVVREMMGTVSRDPKTQDWILEERVRAEIGRVSRHSSAIQVSADQGTVRISGPILADEVDRVLSHVNKVRSVNKVENNLEVHESAENIPALQGEPQIREPKMELMQQNWSPTARFATGLGGLLLTVYGMSRRGITGSLVSLGGLALAARGVTNIEFKRLIGVGSGRRAIDLQKDININAPVEEVFRFWDNYENLPKFMAHVKEVRNLGDGRSHWVVKGPAGTEIEWNAVTTKREPNQMIAWKSEPDAAVQSAGIVQFMPNEKGGTRVKIRMSYNPPAGAIGHAVASILGHDPKRAMDEDMVRLKSLIEHGKTTAGGQEVRREDVSGGSTGTAS